MKRNTYRFALIPAALLALAASSVHADDKTAGTSPDASSPQQVGTTVAAPAEETPPVAQQPQSVEENSAAAAALDGSAPAAASAPQPAASRSALSSANPGTDNADSDGKTALQRAAIDGRLDGVKQLIADGSNVNYARPYNQCTALMYAAENGHTEIVRVLLESGADANAVANEKEGNRSALLYATEKNHPEIVQLLLAAGANPNHAGSNGKPPLLLATDRKEINADIVKALLEKGANPNVTGRNDQTPLVFATDRSDINAEIVKALLTKGANPSVLGQNGWSPIGNALHYANKDAISALLDAGADLNSNKFPTLELAMRQYEGGDKAAYWNDLIRRLVAGGADTNAIMQDGKGCTWRGSTVLMSAVACGAVEAAQFLIAGGANVNAVAETGTLKGLSPLNIAVKRKGYLNEQKNAAAAAQLVEILRAAGAHE